MQEWLLSCLNNKMFREPRFLPNLSPEQFVQLICQAEERQAEFLEILHQSKMDEKCLEAYLPTRFKRDFRHAKAGQMDHLN